MTELGELAKLPDSMGARVEGDRKPFSILPREEVRGAGPLEAALPGLPQPSWPRVPPAPRRAESRGLRPGKGTPRPSGCPVTEDMQAFPSMQVPWERGLDVLTPLSAGQRRGIQP